MISFFAHSIANALIKAQMLEKADQELYEYGFCILLSQIFFFLITMLLGIILDIIGESIIFYFSFTLLRGYAGGYHAKTENICTILTIVSLILCAFGIYFLKKLDIIIIPLIVTGINSLLIFILCPLDSDNKPINENELASYRVKSRQIVCGIIVLAVFFSAFDCNCFLYAATLCVSLESILLILGKKRM